jgi:hypothetical protein
VRSRSALGLVLHRRVFRRSEAHHQDGERQQQDAAAQVNDAHVRGIVMGHVADQQARKCRDCHVQQETDRHVVGLEEIAGSFLEKILMFFAHINFSKKMLKQMEADGGQDLPLDKHIPQLTALPNRLFYGTSRHLVALPRLLGFSH